MTSKPIRSQLTGFGALAKRISLWTTNSLLTVIVLAAGVGFGRQVLAWWAADSSRSAAALATTLPLDKVGDSSLCHVIHFGDQPWSFRRQSVSGDKPAAAERLRVACRELLREGSSSAVGLLPAGDGKCPVSLSKMKPLDEEPGKWRLYELCEAFPLAIGIARLPSITPQPTTMAAMPIDSQYRVALWGMAMPAGPERWSLLIFQPEKPSAEKRSGLSDIPLPPATHRTLSIAATGGEEMAVFSGLDRCDAWRHFYSDWFARHGWQAAAAWRNSGGAWHVQCVAPDHGRSVDVSLSRDGHGNARGLVITTPHNVK